MNIQSILDFHKIKIRSESGENYSCHCPFHNDRNCSFSIHKNTGLWICFAGCGQGNIVSFISKFLDLSYQESVDYFHSNFGYDKIINENIKNKLSNISKIPVSGSVNLPSEFISFKSTKFENYPTYFSYIQSRISNKTINKFNIGFCDSGQYSKRIIIPIVFNKINVGFIARAIDPRMKRYLNPSGFKASKFLFNFDSLDANSKDIYVCESTFDALTLDSWGYDVIATFGAKISISQLIYLSSFSNHNIKFVFHNDPAGIHGVFSQVKLLKTIFPSLYWIKMPEDMDVNSLTKEEFLKSETIPLLYDDKKMKKIKSNISLKLEGAWKT